jgi:predicted MFS family arabinose efflux permease
MRRGITLLAGAIGLSALGDFLAVVPLALLLEHETGSGFAVAGLFVAMWSPSIVLAGPAGLLVDRVDPRRVLVVASLAQAALAVALAFVGSTGPLLALAALLGAANAVAQPAEFALLPRVAGEDELARANGRMEAARYAGFTLGPAVGALLAAGGGTRVALLVDAATFAVIAVAAALLRPRAPAREARDGAGRAREGVAFLRRDDVLRGVLPVAIAALLVMTAVATAEVFYAKDVLGAGDLGYGAMMTAWMAGMVVGATAVAARIPTGAAASAALLAIAVQGLGIALPAAYAALAFALAAFAAGGIAHGAKNVLIRTLIHRRTPEHLHGRAFAAYGAARNAAELSALAIGGTLVAVAGPRLTMAVAGGAPALLALAALARRHLHLPAAGEGRERRVAAVGASAAGEGRERRVAAVGASAAERRDRSGAGVGARTAAGERRGAVSPSPRAPAPGAAPPPTPAPAAAPARPAPRRGPSSPPIGAPAPAGARAGGAPP